MCSPVPKSTRRLARSPGPRQLHTLAHAEHSGGSRSLCRGRIVLSNQDLGSPTPSAQASIFFIGRRPSATTAKPKDAPESISQTMSRTWNKSNVGLRVALEKAPMPEQHASRIHLFVSISGPPIQNIYPVRGTIFIIQPRTFVLLAQ